MQGKVVWFSKEKGFGFLRAEGTDADTFCHYSAIQMSGYKELKKDQRVEFDVEKGPKDRLQATNVKVIS